MTDDSELERFARALMAVRDRSIEAVDRLAAPDTHGRSPSYQRWREVLGDSTAARDAVRALIPDIVDQVLFALLDAVDNNAFPLAWLRKDDTCVPLSELGEGEMAGSLMMSGGWRQRFSRQPSVDTFKDLTLELDEDGP
jgi:hypothetical protein